MKFSTTSITFFFLAAVFVVSANAASLRGSTRRMQQQDGQAEATTTGSIKIVQLGDDYSSGNAASADLMDSTWFGPKLCWRNQNSWGQQVANQLFGSDVSFKNAACSGATLSDLTSSQSSADDVEAQINAVTADTDVVMLTIGANDAKYEQITKNCFITGLTGGSIKKCTEVTNLALTYLASGFRKSYQDYLMNVAQKMKPTGKIVVAAYPFLAVDKKSDRLVLDDDKDFGKRNQNIRAINNVMIAEQFAAIKAVNQQLGREQVSFYTGTIKDFAGKEGITGRESNMIPTPTKPNPNGYFKEFTYSTNYDYDKPVGNKATFYRINNDGHSALASGLAQWLKSNNVINASSSTSTE